MSLFKNTDSSSTKKSESVKIKRGLVVVINDKRYTISSIEDYGMNIMLYCTPTEEK